MCLSLIVCLDWYLYYLSHSNINTFPSCSVPSLLYLQVSVIPRSSKKLFCSFEARIKMFLQSGGNQGTSPPGGFCRESVTQVRKHHTHTPGSSFDCCSCSTTFLFDNRNLTWNMIVPGCTNPPTPRLLDYWGPLRRGDHLVKSEWSKKKLWEESLNRPLFSSFFKSAHVYYVIFVQAVKNLNWDKCSSGHEESFLLQRR